MSSNEQPQAKRPWTNDAETKAWLKKGARRGPWRRARLLVALILALLLVGLAAWLVWPRAQVPLLLVVAYDQVAVAGKMITLHAAAVPKGGGQTHWAGRDVYFEQARGQVPGSSGTTKKAKTDDNGFAAVEYRFEATPRPVDVEVRYVDETQRPPWFANNQSRIFVWGEASRILVLDIEPWLKQNQDWTAVAKALTAAADKGWHIVYLCVGPEPPFAYQGARAAGRQLIGAAPDGPILPRSAFPGQPSTQGAPDNGEILIDLQNRFAGPVLFIDAIDRIQLSRFGPNGRITSSILVLSWDSLAALLPQ
jgi:hypothetical protein